MSLKQSKKIVEATGLLCSNCSGFGYRQDHWSGCDGSCSAGKCPIQIECPCEGIPDLSLPENRHLLIGYVEKICDTARKKAVYVQALKIQHAHSPTDERIEGYRWGFYGIWEANRISNDRMMNAACRVIKDKPERAGG